MTQVKNNVNLREQFNALSKNEQDAIVNYFNLHNAAIWIFCNLLSDDSRSYVNNCITFSQNTDEVTVEEKCATTILDL